MRSDPCDKVNLPFDKMGIRRRPGSEQRGLTPTKRLQQSNSVSQERFAALNKKYMNIRVVQNQKCFAPSNPTVRHNHNGVKCFQRKHLRIASWIREYASRMSSHGLTIGVLFYFENGRQSRSVLQDFGVCCYSLMFLTVKDYYLVGY